MLKQEYPQDEIEMSSIEQYLLENKNIHMMEREQLNGMNYVQNQDGESFLMKIISINDGSGSICQNKLQNAQIKINFLRECNHPNILKLHDSFQLGTSVIMILESCEKTLMDWKEENNKFDRESYIQLSIEILESVEYLHSKNLFLKNISLSTILLSPTQSIKILDFGFPKQINPFIATQNFLQKSQDDQEYLFIAPEILELGQQSSSKQIVHQTIEHDIWTVGIILFMLTCIKNKEARQVMNLIQGFEQYTINKNLDFDINQAFKQILKRNPVERPSIERIIQIFKKLKERSNLIINSNSNEEDFQLKQVIQLHEEKEYEQSLSLLTKMVEENPINDQYLAWMGRIQYIQKKFNFSKYWCKQSLKINPKNDMAYFVQGNIYERDGYLDEAIECYKLCVYFSPKNGLALNNLGLVLQNKSLYDESIKYYKQALEVMPCDKELLNNIGTLYYQLKNNSNAQYYYHKSLEINSEQESTLFNLGLLYGEEQLYDKSIESFKRVLQIKPYDYEAQTELGIIYLKIQEYKKAIKQFKASFLIKPKYINLLCIGQIFLENKLYEKAIKQFEDILKEKSKFSGGLRYLGIIHLELEKYDVALNYFSQATQQYPNDFQSQNYLGICYLNQKKYLISQDYFNNAHVIKPASNIYAMNLKINNKQAQKFSREKALD